jgi:hypothetical protein
MSTGIVTKTKREKDRDPEIEDVIEEDLDHILRVLESTNQNILGAQRKIERSE